MARIETTQRTLYAFSELSDRAKEKARDWWRECEANDFDHECVYEDAATIGALFGLNIRQKPVKLMNGNTRYTPAIFYSGFSSQGDGACFEGAYSYAKGAAKAVKAYAPKDKELHSIVDRLQAVQKRSFYRISASTAHRGRYYHSGCMEVSVEIDAVNRQTISSDDEEEVIQCLRDFADWVYSRLNAEWDYIMSDENVDEAIAINGYEFDASGRIA